MDSSHAEMINISNTLLHPYTNLCRPSVSDLPMLSLIHIVKHESVRHSYAMHNLIKGFGESFCAHTVIPPQLSPPPA